MQKKIRLILIVLCCCAVRGHCAAAVAKPRLILTELSDSLAGIPASQRQQKIDANWRDRASIVSTSTVTDAKLKVWYQKPAGVWEEALPLGNGRIGAMVFGGVADERVQLNENTLWAGEIKEVANPKGKMALPKIQQLLFEGNNKAAVELADSTLMGVPERIKPYQSFGELWLDMPHLKAANYHRVLDLENAVSRVTYEQDGVHFTREYFISAPKNVLVIHYTASRQKALDLNFTWKRAQDYTVTTSADDPNSIILEGQIGAEFQHSGEKGLRFAGIAKVLLKGGKLKNENGRIEIRDADEITLLISCATDYPGLAKMAAGQSSSGLNPLEVCKKSLKNCQEMGLREIRQQHIDDYQHYFNRVQLTLKAGSAQESDLPTDSLIRLTRSSKIVPATLIAKYFQFGRYLLISSSRPGEMPANLQGLWAWQMNPPWNADFHTNINLQMNYWAAESTNLSEMHLPLFDLTKALIPSGQKTAQTTYGAKGWVVHHLTDAWGFTAPADGVQGIWPMGAAWLARHPWEHYAYTKDVDFLKNSAYPIVKGAVEFMLDFIVKIPDGKKFAGYWTTNPSHSPENSFVLPTGEVSSFTYGATMDTQIIRDLLRNYIEMTEILKVDQELSNRCREVLAKLIPTQISSKTGRVMEWIEDYQEKEVQHRHVSHLYGLYPSSEISVLQTPALAEAAKKTLNARGDGATGWSLAWKINMWNRLHDGNHSYLLFEHLISDKTLPNLFDNHPPFQIDGNFGATAALAEMCMQSHVKDEKGNYIIELLPAMGEKMPDGAIKGLKARGNVEVDIRWEKGGLTQAILKPKYAGNVMVRYNGKTIQLKSDGRQQIKIDPKSFL